MPNIFVAQKFDGGAAGWVGESVYDVENLTAPLFGNERSWMTGADLAEERVVGTSSQCRLVIAVRYALVSGSFA